LEQGEGWEGRVVHVEDEPESAYSQIVEHGIAPGSKVRVERASQTDFQIRHEGRSVQLNRAAVANLTVMPLAEGDALDDSIQRLSSLRPGEKARVKKLSAACRGQERARLLDMGIVPGSVIEPAFTGLFQSPVAYRVKDSVLALRKEQADHVLVQKIA
jgi:DtxR family Mn-dependent transcriptional regulator